MAVGGGGKDGCLTLSESFADRVSLSCHEAYDKLPKKGKPQSATDWTLLAAILYTSDTDTAVNPTVVALGTGSKCIGQNKMSMNGDVVNDSHAEILARRAFLCYLYDQLTRVCRGDDSKVLERSSSVGPFGCQVKDGIQFHMYTSHTPCGDASIFPKQEDRQSDIGDIVEGTDGNTTPPDNTVLHGIPELKRKLECDHPIKSTSKKMKTACCALLQSDPAVLKQGCGIQGEATCRQIQGEGQSRSQGSWHDSSPVDLKHLNTERSNGGTGSDKDRQVSGEDGRSERLLCGNSDTCSEPVDSVGGDIYRTGAKCVPGGDQDPRGAGVAYHCTGALRIKPGRGDRTLSMACSDKLARWNVVGCQGALLSHFLTHPVYLHILVIGRCPFNAAALKRAVIDRVAMVTDLPPGYHVNNLKCYQSSRVFCDGREACEARVSQGRAASREKSKPSPTATTWYQGQSTGVEVSVNGRKQGVTSKASHSPKARCEICCLEMFQKFHKLVSSLPVDQRPSSLQNIDLTSSYWQCKSAATSYQSAWNRLKQVFSSWISKPRDHLQFSCEAMR